MKAFFMWTGGFLALLAILLMFTTGAFYDYQVCEPIMDNLVEFKGDATASAQFLEICRNFPAEEGMPVSLDLCAQSYINYCSGLSNNLYITYIIIIVGIALLVGGYLTTGDKNV